MKSVSQPIVFLFSVVLFACGSSRPLYKYQLANVQRGDAMSDESRGISQPLVFENADFKIIWSPGPLTYFFRIENKSKADLQINFDKSFLISPAGNAFSAIHPGNSALAKGDDKAIIPAQVGIDTWVRPGQKYGENHGGLVGSLSPGFDGGGFFPETGDAADLKRDYVQKTATVVLNIGRPGAAQNYRFKLQIADVVEQ